MSHDRGCSCGREKYEADDCPNWGCQYKEPLKEKKMSEVQKLSEKVTEKDRILNDLKDMMKSFYRDNYTVKGDIIFNTIQYIQYITKYRIY